MNIWLLIGMISAHEVNTQNCAHFLLYSPINGTLINKNLKAVTNRKTLGLELIWKTCQMPGGWNVLFNKRSQLKDFQEKQQDTTNEPDKDKEGETKSSDKGSSGSPEKGEVDPAQPNPRSEEKKSGEETSTSKKDDTSKQEKEKKSGEETSKDKEKHNPQKEQKEKTAPERPEQTKKTPEERPEQRTNPENKAPPSQQKEPHTVVVVNENNPNPVHHSDNTSGNTQPRHSLEGSRLLTSDNRKKSSWFLKNTKVPIDCTKSENKASCFASTSPNEDKKISKKSPSPTNKPSKSSKAKEFTETQKYQESEVEGDENVFDSQDGINLKDIKGWEINGVSNQGTVSLNPLYHKNKCLTLSNGVVYLSSCDPLGKVRTDHSFAVLFLGSNPNVNHIDGFINSKYQDLLLEFMKGRNFQVEDAIDGQIQLDNLINDLFNNPAGTDKTSIDVKVHHPKEDFEGEKSGGAEKKEDTTPPGGKHGSALMHRTGTMKKDSTRKKGAKSTLKSDYPVTVSKKTKTKKTRDPKRDVEDVSHESEDSEYSQFSSSTADTKRGLEGKEAESPEENPKKANKIFPLERRFSSLSAKIKGDEDVLENSEKITKRVIKEFEIQPSQKRKLDKHESDTQEEYEPRKHISRTKRSKSETEERPRSKRTRDQPKKRSKRRKRARLLKRSSPDSPSKEERSSRRRRAPKRRYSKTVEKTEQPKARRTEPETYKSEEREVRPEEGGEVQERDVGSEEGYEVHERESSAKEKYEVIEKESRPEEEYEVEKESVHEQPSRASVSGSLKSRPSEQGDIQSSTSNDSGYGEVTEVEPKPVVKPSLKRRTPRRRKRRYHPSRKSKRLASRRQRKPYRASKNPRKPSVKSKEEKRNEILELLNQPSPTSDYESAPEYESAVEETTPRRKPERRRKSDKNENEKLVDLISHLEPLQKLADEYESRQKRTKKRTDRPHHTQDPHENDPASSMHAEDSPVSSKSIVITQRGSPISTSAPPVQSPPPSSGFSAAMNLASQALGAAQAVSPIGNLVRTAGNLSGGAENYLDMANILK